ncbi:type I-E CRISPR-associated protein Cas5/CasD [Kitasatospora sp. NPDC002040]|uniref:type I-E CRISPR-associated protein Cas5/CasD n=1 Tax=Kitasatospora sp. NPDC002040 TaxID=3154661 RepID=UPI0033320EF8
MTGASPVLVLHLTGVLQSWGVRSGFTEYRDSAEHPTRSGVLGFLACALGKPRGSGPEELDQLDLTVRVDRPGTPMEDYHTIGGQTPEEVIPSADGGTRKGATLTRRAYLADAAFTIVLTGPAIVLTQACDALDRPTYIPFLGRRACPPDAPFNLGLHSIDVEQALRTAPLNRIAPRDRDTVTVDVISTVNPGDPAATHTLNDNPRNGRRFAQRTLARTTLTLPAGLCTGADPSDRYTALHNFRHPEAASPPVAFAAASRRAAVRKPPTASPPTIHPLAADSGHDPFALLGW